MFVRLVMVVVFLLAGLNLAAAQGRRVALVIGNGGYRNIPRLTNPSHDATLIAQTLQGLGFQLVGGGARIDLDKTAFDAAVRDFGQQVQGADVALFYYSGHGLQVDGRNWLVPLDANPTRVQDLDFQMVDAQLVLHQMEGSGTKLNLMILDACRNNPFGGRGLRGADGGLAQMRAPEGTLISYATQPGNTAADGTGQNSPYTQALAENLRQPGLDVLRMFNQVGVAVKKATGRAQQPWVSSSPLDSVYYLAGPGTNGAVLPPNPDLTHAPETQPQTLKPPKSTPPFAPLEDDARAFVLQYFGSWSENNVSAMTFVQSIYADPVDFYGKPTSRNTIVAMKKAFIERWPGRTYSVRWNSVSISCDQPAGTCIIRGLVDWECRNPIRGAKSAGLADFTIGVMFGTTGSRSVYLEAGAVVTRSTDR